MKLLINISDEAYELCKRGTTDTFLINGMRSGKTFLMSLYKAIANGMPLIEECQTESLISQYQRNNITREGK